MVSRPMKESGIEWIGQVPKEWNIAPISRLFFIKAGGDAKPEFYSDNSDKNHPYPVYTNTHIENKVYAYTSNPLFPEKSITVSGRGAIGKAFYRNTPFDAIIRLIVLVAKFNLDSRYFAYFISVVIPFNTGSSAIGQLSTLQIAPYKLAVPPVEEQQKIASFLDEKVAHIDSILEDTKESIQDLKAYKKSLITETVTKGLNANVEMKDSGIEWIGEIPKHWQLGRLKYVLSEETNSLRVGPFGSHLKNSDFTLEGKWVYNQRTVLDKNFNSNDTFISDEKYEEMQAFKIDAGEILLTTRGTIGKIARVPDNFFEGIIHSSIIKFKLDNKKYRYDLLEIIFNHSSFIEKQIKYFSNATTIEVIYSHTLKNIFIPIIPLDEQGYIVKYLLNKIDSIDSLIEEKNHLLLDLESYKKSFIYEYVTGKKEVQ